MTDIDAGGTPLPAPEEVVVDGVRWRHTNYDNEWMPVDEKGNESWDVQVAPLWADGDHAGEEQKPDGSWVEIEPRAWLISFGVYYPGTYDGPPESDFVDWQERPDRETAMRDGWAELQRRQEEDRVAEEALMKHYQEMDAITDAARDG